jgi:hypothetical protein
LNYKLKTGASLVRELEILFPLVFQHWGSSELP